LYPVRCAADRLKLQDEKTHEDLPAARLEFLGHTLLEGMIRDLQAREYVYFQVFHKQIITPIALMTSHEKNNHELVQEIIQQAQYFGRPKESFKIFAQPLVPTFTQDGIWCLKAPMQLLLKPGGHGVIWKLAAQEKVLDWFLSQGRKKVLVRQINNPIAGVDLGLIALTGVGCKEKKLFGFASCVRRVKTSEGMNVLKERVSQHGIYATLSNIEYCDFEKLGIQDRSQCEGDPYSVFPSNTNILFADVEAMRQAVEDVPYPGMLVNLKSMKYYGQEDPNATVARLELLMQNIADAFEEKIPQPLQENLEPELPTFIVFNKRHKTISPTKKQFVPKSGLVETALGCFYDYLKNCKELLEGACGFDLPNLPAEEAFLKEGPSFIAVYHPCLGPLYSIISQKIYGGSLARGSELQLEIAEVKIEKLSIQGSLLVQSDQVMGHQVEGVLSYSNQVGRCYLKNVTVKNEGINFSKPNIFWKNKIYRKQACSIRLEGFSEFRAENVVLEGNLSIVVKNGEKVTAVQEGDCVVFVREPLKLEETKAYWQYTLSLDQTIELVFQNY
ncbi:MAG: UTP--glucose-1-phosphate uridylyltransferase, partial [Chlamydiota bacterium]